MFDKNLIMKALKKVIFFLFLFLLHYVAVGQTGSPNDTLKYRIETQDGNEYIGIIKEETPEYLIVVTDNLGELKINIKDIKRKTSLGKARKVGNQYWLENPQETRYFWQPNGYGLKKGEGYYQNVWVLFNSFAVGVNDYFSIGGGIIPLFFFAGTSTPVWITPKFSIPVKENTYNVGLGVLAGTVLGEEEAGFGILYGINTFGTRDNNVSIGVGYGYTGDELADSPTITLSAMFRTGARGYFITENYYISAGNDSFLLLSFGGRRIIKKVGLDFGLFIPAGVDSDSFIAIPWLGLTVPFGNR